MKISEAEREEVKRMYFEQGMTRKDIAEEKGISRRYVNAIINNRDVRYDYRTSSRRKPPAGRITFEMIGQVRRKLQIGDTVIVDVEIEENGYTYYRTRECPVIEKHKHIFVVQVGKSRSAFKYVDLMIEAGVRAKENGANE